MIRMLIVSIVFFISIPSIFATNERICHQCEGINCYRTTYNQTEKCLDPLDICVTIFDKNGVVQRGCSLGLPENHRSKCGTKKTNPYCHKCNENFCNDVNRNDLLCVQCDSKQESKCSNDGEIAPARCPIGKSGNSYCYINRNGNDIIRGCSTNTKHQRECFGSVNCMLCMPNDIRGCNRINFVPGSARSFFIY